MEQKTEVAHLADALAFAGKFAYALAGLKRGESVGGRKGAATRRIARLSSAAQWEEFAEKMDLGIIM